MWSSVRALLRGAGGVSSTVTFWQARAVPVPSAFVRYRVIAAQRQYRLTFTDHPLLAIPSWYNTVTPELLIDHNRHGLARSFHLRAVDGKPADWPAGIERMGGIDYCRSPGVYDRKCQEPAVSEGP